MSETSQPASAPASGLDVAAIICAILVAPVGLILGLISRAKARRLGLRPNVVATAAVVVGAVLSGLYLLSVLAPLLMAAAFTVAG